MFLIAGLATALVSETLMGVSDKREGLKTLGKTLLANYISLSEHKPDLTHLIKKRLEPENSATFLPFKTIRRYCKNCVS